MCAIIETVEDAQETLRGLGEEKTSSHRATYIILISRLLIVIYKFCCRMIHLQNRGLQEKVEDTQATLRGLATLESS